MFTWLFTFTNWAPEFIPQEFTTTAASSTNVRTLPITFYIKHAVLHNTSRTQVWDLNVNNYVHAMMSRLIIQTCTLSSLHNLTTLSIFYLRNNQQIIKSTCMYVASSRNNVWILDSYRSHAANSNIINNYIGCCYNFASTFGGMCVHVNVRESL